MHFSTIKKISLIAMASAMVTFSAQAQPIGLNVDNGDQLGSGTMPTPCGAEVSIYDVKKYAAIDMSGNNNNLDLSHKYVVVLSSDKYIDTTSGGYGNLFWRQFYVDSAAEIKSEVTRQFKQLLALQSVRAECPYGIRARNAVTQVRANPYNSFIVRAVWLGNGGMLVTR